MPIPMVAMGFKPIATIGKNVETQYFASPNDKTVPNRNARVRDCSVKPTAAGGVSVEKARICSVKPGPEATPLFLIKDERLKEKRINQIIGTQTPNQL